MKIGITSSVAYEPGGEIHPDVIPYARAVERAGGEAVLLDCDVPFAKAVLEPLGGVIASGGVDVEVARYGGRADHARSQAHRYRPARDEFEIALLRTTRESGLPTLCICRGLQVANVAFGGTLIEDVREELGARYTIEHAYKDVLGLDRADYVPGHDVVLEQGCGLAEVLGQTHFATNSMHHQAARTLGDGLVAVGRTHDGIIEALGATFAHPFFHAVQWHPEELADAISFCLFAALTTAAARHDAAHLEARS